MPVDSRNPAHPNGTLYRTDERRRLENALVFARISHKREILVILPSTAIFQDTWLDDLLHRYSPVLTTLPQLPSPSEKFFHPVTL